MLFLTYVDGDVLVLGASADDHAFVYIHAGADEQPAALLSGIQAVGDRLACLIGNQRALVAGDDIALIRLVGIKDMVHDTVAVGVGEELGAITHQSARRDAELDMRCAAVAGAHVDELSLAGAELLHHSADIRLGHLDDQVLDRLAQHAVDHLGDDLGAADLKLIALAAHGLDEDREMQLASARHLEGIGGVGLFHAHGDVGLHLFEEAVAQVARGNILALAARKGRIVDNKVHRHGRLVDLDERQGVDMLGVADGLADIDVGDAGQADEVAHLGGRAFHALEPLELVEL